MASFLRLAARRSFPAAQSVTFNRTATVARAAAPSLMKFRPISTSIALKEKEIKDVAPGCVPTDEELETHLTLFELEQLKLGNDDLWYTTPPKHFGTYENPCIIPSFEDSRILGCSGGKGPGEPPAHDILWFELEANEELECNRCGQVFVLKQVPDHFPRYDGEGEH